MRLGEVKHGHAKRNSRSPEYQIWSAMISRCRCPKTQRYSRYGGRGIKVCQRWMEDFSNFLADMGSCPSKTHSLERLDNNGDYCQENCKWATRREQYRNKSTNRKITVNGVTNILRDWAIIAGVHDTTIVYRIKKGWPLERAVYTPSTRG